jgi:hypothetical protein
MVGHQLFDFAPIPVPQASTGKPVILHKAIEVEADQKVLKPWISAKVVVKGIDPQ